MVGNQHAAVGNISHRLDANHATGVALQNVENCLAIDSELEARNTQIEESFDSATIYSTDSGLAVTAHDYIRAFTQRLSLDLKVDFSLAKLLDTSLPYIEETMRLFSWSLYQESKNLFQWEVCVALQRKRQ
jgi:hypothetical protein